MCLLCHGCYDVLVNNWGINEVRKKYHLSVKTQLQQHKNWKSPLSKTNKKKMGSCQNPKCSKSWTQPHKVTCSKFSFFVFCSFNHFKKTGVRSTAVLLATAPHRPNSEHNAQVVKRLHHGRSKKNLNKFLQKTLCFMLCVFCRFWFVWFFRSRRSKEEKKRTFWILDLPLSPQQHLTLKTCFLQLTISIIVNVVC